jgi:hypothetical protein
MREQHRKGLARYLKTGEGPLLGKRIEIAALRRDGSEILVELAIAAYKIKGSPVFTAYLRDMTERLRNDRRRVAQYNVNVASLLAGSSTLAEAGAQLLEIIAPVEIGCLAPFGFTMKLPAGCAVERCGILRRKDWRSSLSCPARRRSQKAKVCLAAFGTQENQPGYTM